MWLTSFSHKTPKHLVVWRKIKKKCTVSRKKRLTVKTFVATIGNFVSVMGLVSWLMRYDGYKFYLGTERKAKLHFLNNTLFLCVQEWS